MFSAMSSAPLFLAILAAVLALADARGGDYLCKECMDVSQRGQEFLSDPKNQDAAIAYVEAAVCERSVVPDRRNKCKDAVEEYVPVVFASLQDYVSPDRLCVQSGLCKLPSSACTFCHLMTSSTGKVLVGLSRLCRFLGFAECNSFAEQQSSKLSVELCGACNTQSRVHKRQQNPSNCALCKYLVAELKVKLHDPKNQEKLLEFMVDNCHKLQSHEEECELLVLEYGPMVLANVDTFLDDRVCTRIGMCSEGWERA